MTNTSRWSAHHLVFLIVAGLLLLVPHKAQARDDANIAFNWSLIATSDISDSVDIFPIEKDLILKTGDSIKMMIEPLSDCHLYILFHTSSGEILTLFNSSDPLWSGKKNLTNRKIYIPDGEAWLTLDDGTGTEKLFVLASKDPLEGFETLLNDYNSAVGEEQSALADKIVAEIRAHRLKNMRFKAIAERPIQLGGTFRGKGETESRLPDIIDSFALTYYGYDFLAKSYTIDHR